SAPVPTTTTTTTHLPGGLHRPAGTATHWCVCVCVCAHDPAWHPKNTRKTARHIIMRTQVGFVEEGTHTHTHTHTRNDNNGDGRLRWRFFPVAATHTNTRAKRTGPRHHQWHTEQPKKNWRRECVCWVRVSVCAKEETQQIPKKP